MKSRTISIIFVLNIKTANPVKCRKNEILMRIICFVFLHFPVFWQKAKLKVVSILYCYVTDSFSRLTPHTSLQNVYIQKCHEFLTPRQRINKILKLIIISIIQLLSHQFVYCLSTKLVSFLYLPYFQFERFCLRLSK